MKRVFGRVPEDDVEVEVVADGRNHVQLKPFAGVEKLLFEGPVGEWPRGPQPEFGTLLLDAVDRVEVHLFIELADQ